MPTISHLCAGKYILIFLGLIFYHQRSREGINTIALSTGFLVYSRGPQSVGHGLFATGPYEWLTGVNACMHAAHTQPLVRASQGLRTPLTQASQVFSTPFTWANRCLCTCACPSHKIIPSFPLPRSSELPTQKGWETGLHSSTGNWSSSTSSSFSGWAYYCDDSLCFFQFTFLSICFNSSLSNESCQMWRHSLSYLCIKSNRLGHKIP